MSVIERIVQSVDIVDYVSEHTTLKRIGNTYRGSCPLHGGGNDSSFTIFPDKRFYCFACGKGGNIIDFVAEQEGISYHEAIEYLAEKANLDITLDKEYQKEKTVYEKNQNLANKYHNQLDKVSEYLEQERGIIKATQDSFFLGFSSGSRGKSIVIPLHDKNGRIVAFSKRYIDSLPKYVNSKNNEFYDKSEFLFNEYRAKRQLHKNKRLYICEGYMDAISAYQQECACVAYCGSELSNGQINEIRDMLTNIPNVVIMYAPDNDATGQSKIIRTWEKFQQLYPRADVRCVKFPEGRKDFNEVLCAGDKIVDLPSEPIALAAIKQALQNSIDQTQEYNIASDMIKTVRNPVLKSEIIEYLAKRWNKPISDIKDIANMDFSSDEKIDKIKSVDDCIADYIELINTEGLGIGFPSIDTAMKLRPTDVVFWAGYSGTYKTMVAGEVALHNAIRLKKNVLFFSLEMSAGSLYERLIARILHKSTDEIQDMVKSGTGTVLFNQVKEKLQQKLLIVDESNLRMQDIEEYIKVTNLRKLQDGQVDMVILDYFQYLNMNTFEEQSAAAKYTKVIAKKYNLVFFALSQLNRTGDNFLKPSLKMLKGTGDMEASSDYVALCWVPAENPKLSLDERARLQDHICIAVGKARRGVAAREFELKYDKKESKLIDLGVEGQIIERK